jgi:putative holliday junction resolvase
VRTGVAISDAGGVIASPLEVVPSAELTAYLRRLVDERAVREVVVGVPRTLAGEVGFQARSILATLDGLKRDFPGVRFVEWDERLTTRIAAAESRRGNRKKKPARLDHLAAARLLQEYLEAERST